MQSQATKFKSTLEEKFHQSFALPYEQSRFAYKVVHHYTPDWCLAPNHFIETKGRWESADRSKLKAVIAQNPHIKIVMVFQNSKTKLNKKSSTTYADWCDKHQITYFQFGTPELTQYIAQFIDEPVNLAKSHVGDCIELTHRDHAILTHC
ncbi:PDDEXK family nuclease [Roseateles albus]|uniref:Uncharacterized protein n=1 Tax=Roseateles albus TaxID=2987525 RepID=A0ABT5KHY8_9BURK|nr:hypothetical protein [Roseateles albus]MDC8773562.1 hypothetical protein [Roseateles albus]